MKFLIEISGDTQPGLINALDEVRKQLIDGRCFLNICGFIDAKMRPATDKDEGEFRRQHADTRCQWTS